MTRPSFFSFLLLGMFNLSGSSLIACPGNTATEQAPVVKAVPILPELPAPTLPPPAHRTRRKNTRSLILHSFYRRRQAYN